ncbi:MAG: hypothetical protein HYT30_00780 [Parcubacteria group bacterium]|nr:hypothetical protein [Parcubacteria group bacterium]
MLETITTYFLAQSPEEQYALVGGVLVFIGYIIYWFATVFGKTRPNRVTWAILTLVGFAIAASYWDASDASPNARGIAIAHALGAFGTFISSLWYGQLYDPDDGNQRRIDIVCLVLGLGSIVVWQAHVWNVLTIHQVAGLEIVVIALALGIIADFFGLAPTIRKAWKDPQSESLVAWGLTVIGEIIGLWGITNWASIGEISYPVYLVFANGLVVLLLLKGFFARTFRNKQAISA